MPELPEVETIRTMLRDGTQDIPSIVGWAVKSGRVLWSRTLKTPTVEELQFRLPGQTILDIGRRGKYLMVYLTQDVLLLHLRMSGDVWVEAAGQEDGKHYRLAIDFENGQRLIFNDPRKFGRAWLVGDAQTVLGGLGPEPLDDGFTPQILYARLQASRRQIKPLLLNQAFLAGLGNIYTDEALHLARLHPLMLSKQVSLEQAERLWEAIRSVLSEGIRRNGASIDWVYRGGDFQNYFRVYQRTGQPCMVCGTVIERMIVGQRGTHFCPVCQPKM